MADATVVTARSEYEMHEQVVALGDQGYRIVSVLKNSLDYFEIVAQKDDSHLLYETMYNAMHDAIVNTRRAL